MDLAIKAIVSILACFAAAGIGSLCTFRAIPTWYAGLRRPPFTPPNWMFAPIWSTLYVLMAIAVFLVWQKGFTSPGVALAVSLFWAQLGLNALWSLVFFGMRSKGGGLIVIAVLWLLLLATVIASFRVSAWAGGLLVPYLVWLTIALYLNSGFWWLNRGRKAALPNAAPQS